MNSAREECSSFTEKLTGLFSEIVTKSMTVQLLRDLDDLDLTHSQLLALTYIAERRKCTVGGLAEGLHISHPAAVKVLEKLCRKDLAMRSVGLQDHRQTEIVATAAGRALIQRIRVERAQRLASVLDRMEPAERIAMMQGLQGFVTAALRDEGALDALCQSCQAVLPSDCQAFQLISERQLMPAAGAAS